MSDPAESTLIRLGSFTQHSSRAIERWGLVPGSSKLFSRQSVSQIIARNPQQPRRGRHVLSGLFERVLDQSVYGFFK